MGRKERERLYHYMRGVAGSDETTGGSMKGIQIAVSNAIGQGMTPAEIQEAVDSVLELHAPPEPPFNENHYRYHTPNGPNPACPNCRWHNWQQTEEGSMT
jgi:hypothetical protein